ncbi:uncharacterized protein L201_000420 [Kwoniella dendrophila CBS 6074]|uniref:COQ9 C-terminal domain-containing protein n=1 Tax=Kwoniella dendrophila CBS 6074 TaxID=1295534 RepID=A0AAX4JJF8_9TREE
MALRSQILTTSLPLLSTHSFARPTLIQAVRQLKPEISNPDAILDTLFGSGSVGPSKALVERWEEEGLKVMSNSSDPTEKESLGAVLKRRIEYSSNVGQHLVEAHANLTTPTSTLSIPLPPSITILKTLMSNIKIPSSYIPPVLSSSSSDKSMIGQIKKVTGDNSIPLLYVNPLGPLGYAWKIADEALFITEQKSKPKGLVKRGYWNEPTGPGPEWYTKRLGLSLVYLASESNLLQPYPSPTPSSSSTTITTINPHLPKALSSLEINLQRYQSTISGLENTEENLGDVAGFVDYVAKSWGGLIRSRYF